MIGTKYIILPTLQVLKAELAEAEKKAKLISIKLLIELRTLGMEGWDVTNCTNYASI